MSPDQIQKMFTGVPPSLFRVHDWRNDVMSIGNVPASFVSSVSDGLVNEPWPAEINKLVFGGGHDLILSIGQVVPHEVVGMANYTKNILIGTGGKANIDLTHYIGAAYGMERIMGRAGESSTYQLTLRYSCTKDFESRLDDVVLAPSRCVHSHRHGEKRQWQIGCQRPLCW